MLFLFKKKKTGIVTLTQPAEFQIQ